MCCDTARAINVNFTANSHNWSRLQCICFSICFTTELSQSVSLLHNSVAGLCFTSSAHTRAILNWKDVRGGCGDVQDVGVGDISSWRSLAHQQHNLSLCKKSVQVCFHRNDITLYKISRHFFSFVCFTFKWSQVAYHPLHTLLHLLLTSFISSASI